MASRKRRKVAVAAAVCIAAIGGSAGSAFGAGRVEQGVDHANSICAYSGLNDTPNAAFPEGGRVQSYGQLVRVGLKNDPMVFSPGFACNGHRGFFAGG